MRCRACLELIQDELFCALDDQCSNENSKTFADIIFEVTRIDTKTNFTSEFQNVCVVCAGKIRSIYDFVLQVQSANEQIIHYDLNPHDIIFHEIPIDIDENSLELKPNINNFEIGDSIDPCEITNQLDDSSLDEAMEIQSDKEETNLSEDKGEISKAKNLVTHVTLRRSQRQTISKKFKNEVDYKFKRNPKVTKSQLNLKEDQVSNKSESSFMDSGEEWNCDEFLSDDELDLPLKEIEKLEFICDICGKTYTCNKSFIHHVIKKHSIKPKFKCIYCKQMFIKNSQLNAHSKIHSKHWLNNNRTRISATNFNYVKRLYEKQRFKLIQCLLCKKDFKKISHLHSHLMKHKNMKTKKNDNADYDFKECYNIINENGYELCLSEAQDDTDNDDVENQTKYKCELCSESFNHKYKIFSHGLKVHSKESPPFKCSVCKFDFVCEEMLRQHVRQQCRNKFKVFKCINCPGRFMYEENCAAHNCPNPASTTDQAKKFVKLQCEFCGIKFVWIKDLERHLIGHTKFSKDFKCAFCEEEFLRKDNLRKHLKSRHKTEKDLKLEISKLTVGKKNKFHAVSEQLQKPHGYKSIECMLCQSKPLKIAKLKIHLLKHQSDISYADSWKDVNKLSKLLYPEFVRSLNKQELTSRISEDLSNKQYQRFYSIVDDAGYEMNLDSSETETESDDDVNDLNGKILKKYNCEICNASFDRKYKAFQHQSEKHNWDDAKYICHKCGGRFICAELLDWHNVRQCKNPLKRFDCEKCSLSFIWRQNRTNHMRSHAQNIKHEEHETCFKCNTVFKTKYHFKQHLKISSCSDNNVEGLKCFYCPRIFYQFESLSTHLLRHDVTAANFPIAEILYKATNHANGVKNILCRVCNINYSSIKALRNHLLDKSKISLSKHFEFESARNYSIVNSLGFEMDLDDSETENEVDNDELKYQCTICALMFKRKFKLSLHHLWCHKYENLPFKCDRCIFRTVSQNILDHHKRSQCYNLTKKFKCDICSFKFMWSESLNNHKQLHHTEVQKLKIKQTYFECHECGCKYNSEKSLKNHISKSHNSNTILTNNDTKIVSQQKKRFLCTICGTSLSSKQGLIKHTQGHNNEKPYACNLCDKSYRCPNTLKNHRLSHTGKMPYSCTICNKKFRTRTGLRLHTRTHTGERPYSCPFCEKKFRCSSSLLIHKRRHTGEKPFICGVCGTGFIKSELLKKHKTVREHNEVIVSNNSTSTV